MFLDKTFYSYIASLHPGVGITKLSGQPEKLHCTGDNQRISCDGLESHQGGEVIPLVSSYFGNLDKFYTWPGPVSYWVQAASAGAMYVDCGEDLDKLIVWQVYLPILKPSIGKYTLELFILICIHDLQSEFAFTHKTCIYMYTHKTFVRRANTGPVASLGRT